jgi:hypothetical protein
MRRDVPVPALVVVPPQRVRVRGQGCPGKLQDFWQDVLDLERAEDRRRSLEQEPEALDLVGVGSLVFWW